MGAGRPSKYDDETIPKTLYYLDNFKTLGDQIPSIAGLADYLGVSRETVRDWALQEEKAEFSGIIGRLLTKQERTLSNGGLSGDFNSVISKLILGKHGYHDKVDSTLEGKDGKPVPVQYIVQPVRPAGQKEEEDGKEKS